MRCVLAHDSVTLHGQGAYHSPVPAAIDALPAIVQRANGRVEIFMDGGIRRGTDAIKVRGCLLNIRKTSIILNPLAAGAGAGGNGRVHWKVRKAL